MDRIIDGDAVLRRLHTTGALRACGQATLFQGLCRDAQGEHVPVAVVVLDFGAEFPSARYRVVAQDAFGAIAEGSATASIEAAISLVPWQRFVPLDDLVR